MNPFSSESYSILDKQHSPRHKKKSKKKYALLEKMQRYRLGVVMAFPILHNEFAEIF